LSKLFWFNDLIYYFLNYYIEKIYLFKLNNISTFSIDLHIHSTMSIYLYLAMSILVIIHSKTILIKTTQTTFILFNQFYIIVFKHKSILSKSILSESILPKSILSKAEPNTNNLGFIWNHLISSPTQSKHKWFGLANKFIILNMWRWPIKKIYDFF